MRPIVTVAEDAGGMEERLRAFVAHQLPGAQPEVSGVVKTSSGRSRQNWAFDLAWRDGAARIAEQLIVRCDPPGGLVNTDRSVEFELLRALGPTPIPAPAARWLDADGTWFGRPALVMTRAAGTCDYRVLTGDRPLEERLGLARRLCDLLVDLHRLDWSATDLPAVLADPGRAAARAELERWEQVLRADQREPYPELELALLWLRAHAPEAERTVLVHSDYKPGNILFDPADPQGGPLTLLDWELAHLGDPLEDLGWVVQPLRTREQLIEGAWQEGELLERYSHATGWSVDPEKVRWWAMFATFRTAVMQVTGLRAFLEGRAAESYRPTAPVLRTLVELVDA